MAHPKMRHLRQLTDVDCGVACVAMLAGVSYARAMEAAAPGGLVEGRGIYNRELAEVLSRATGAPWRYLRTRPYRPFADRAREAMASGSRSVR